MGKRVVLANELNIGEFSIDGDLVELPLSTLLTPGTYNGITFTAEEIEKAKVPSILPLTLNHSRNVEDEVGFFREVQKVAGSLKAIPVVNLATEKGRAALGYVRNRLAAGLKPNLSVEVWLTSMEGEGGERIATEIEVVKASLVDIGACSPNDGCGVGLKKGEVIELGVVPKHPWNYGKDPNGRWKAPVLKDFTDKTWDELTATEKRSITGHYAWSPANPPERFTDLKLPHHNPETHNVMWNGVRAAMGALAGARGGVNIPAADIKKVYNHLAGHYKEFDKTPPELKFNEDGTWVILMENEEQEQGIVNESPTEQTGLQENEQVKQVEPTNVEDGQKEEVQAEKKPPCDAAKVEILKAELEATKQELQKTKEELSRYIEQERQGLIEKLEKVAPGFDFSGKSITELRDLVKFSEAIRKPGGVRKTAPDVGDKPDPKAVLEVELERKLKQLKREV